MKTVSLLLLGLLLAGQAPAHGLKGLLDKARDKLQTQPATSPEPAIGDSGGAPAVAGFGAVLTSSPAKDFAAAQAVAVTKVVDGQPLWLHLRFEPNLRAHVNKSDLTTDDGHLRYFLWAELGPRGGSEVYQRDGFEFKKEQLDLSELRVALAPGQGGRNQSLSVFLKPVGLGRPGVWENELRLHNRPTGPKERSEYLRILPITADVSDGLPQYRAMAQAYDQAVRRGSAADNQLPKPGRFADARLQAAILAKLKADGVQPARFFFSSDDWEGSRDSDTGARLERTVYAAYTYRKGSDCLSGVAEVTQPYSQISASYGQSLIALRKDSPIQCELLK